jgi:hypothetical protein
MKNDRTKTTGVISPPPDQPRVKVRPVTGWAVALAALMTFVAARSANAQGTAITYQGQLNTDGAPANGIYDISAGLFTTSSGGSAFAGPATNSAVAVSNGLFTVTLDYGNVYNGSKYWVEIGVRTNGGGAFTILSPRQELTPTPYAIFAEGANAAGLSGTLPPGSLVGGYNGVVNFTNPADSFSGNGTGLTGVNAAAVGGLASSNLWTTTGNAGTSPGGNFLGTRDNQPLSLRANNQIGLHLQYWSTGPFEPIPTYGMNIIGGYWGNAISNNASGATIAGGGYESKLLTLPPSSLYYPNVVTGNFGTVGGGYGNSAGTNATISGGYQNSASGTASMVGGGVNNVASGTGAFIGGGGTDGSKTDGNLASGAMSVIGGGNGNASTGYGATTGGGYLNTASGGLLGLATVGGGWQNIASGGFGTVGGGWRNTASGLYGMVPGGYDNVAGGQGSFAAGQYAQTSRDGSFIWGDGTQTPFTGAAADNAFSVLASGGVFLYDGANGLHLDSLDQNNGGLNYGLKFGGALGSGEAIASKRTAGGNQYGLDFFTSSANRLAITVNGLVGINTTTPSEQLEVNGQYALIDGANANNGNGPISAYIGGNGSGNDVQIGSMNSLITAVGFWNYTAGAWMHIGCSSITIHGGADLAEPFPMAAEAKDIPQGAVVVIDDQNPGRVKLSDRPYDSRVAGVISGANGINPGIQMQQQGLLDGGKNVALTGRVYVQADASNGAIRPGDLLTTSSVPGHAMKVTDHAHAQGSILGKAMTGLDQNRGLVLVLVTLQ